MKRPAAAFGLAFMSALVCQSFIGAKLSYYHFIIPAVALPAIVLSLLIKPLRTRREFSVASCAVLLGAAMFVFFSLLIYQPALSAADGETHTIRASLCDLPYKSGSLWYYSLKTETVDGRSETLYFTLRTNIEYDIDPYDTVEGELEFREETYSARIAERSYLTAFTYDRLTVTKNNDNSPPALLLKMRRALISVADSLYGEQEASFVRAIFLGDKTGLSDELTGIFRRTGLAHVLVLSGMHMSVLSLAFISVSRKIFRRRRLANIIAMLPLIFFMALAGFPPSLVRSGVAVIVSLIADCIFRESDPINSLGIAALILCVPNPFAVFDVGMLMSFSSVAGIILYCSECRDFIRRRLPFLKRHKYINNVISPAIETVSVSVCATAATIPFSMLLFRRISNVLLPANLLIVPFVPMIMIISGLSIVLFYIPLLSFFAKPAAFAAEMLIRSVIEWTRLLSKFPFAQSVITKEYIAWGVSIAAVLVLVLLRFKKGRLFIPFVALVISASLLIFTAADMLTLRNNARIKLHSTSSGNLVTIETEEILAEFYTSDDPYPSRGFSETVECTGKDISLFCALNSVSADRPLADELDGIVRYLLLPCSELSFQYPTDGYDMNIEFVQENRTMRLTDEITVELIGIDGDYCASVDISGTKVLILPADVSGEEFIGLDDYSMIIADGSGETEAVIPL